MSHQEIVPFSFKKGLSTTFSNRDMGHRYGGDHRHNDLEMTSRDHDLRRSPMPTMAVHLPSNDSLERSRNKVVLLQQTDSGIHSDTNSNESDNTVRDCMV